MPGQKSGSPASKPGPPPLGLVQPPKGSPFAGISKTNAPAKNTKIPNLTARVTVAKAEKAALTHGGLLTPEQRKAASDAGKALAAHKAIKQAAQPKTAAPRTLASAPAAKGSTASAKTTAKAPRSQAPLVLGAPPAPALGPPSPSPPSAGAPPGYHLAAGALDNYTPNQPGVPSVPAGSTNPRLGMDAAIAKQPKGQITNLSSPAAAIKSEIGTGLHDPLASLLPGGPLAEAVAHHVIGNLTNDAGHAGTKIAAKIQGAGQKAGSIGTNVIPPSLADQFPGQKTVTEAQIRELEAEKGGLGGFSPALRHTLIEGAVKNGWPREDVIKSVDADLMHYYANKPANPIVQFAKNLGSFAATQASGPAGIVALGDAGLQAIKGNPKMLEKQGQQFVEGSMVGLPVIGAHPFLHDLYWHPGESAQNLSLVAGLADRAAGAASRFAPDVARNVTPEGFANPVSRGTLSTRPLQRGIEKTRDAYVNSQNPVLNAQVGEHPLLGPLSPLERRTAVARQAYQATRERAVAPTLAQSSQLRANVMHAARGIGKERATALNAHLQGVEPGARAAFYRGVSEELGGIKGRGAAAHAKLSEKHPVTEATLTPKDRQYVDAVRAAATFATQTRANAGQLSADLGGRYRAYQAPIVVAAKSGDKLAQDTQALHNQWTRALSNKLPPEELAPIADQFKSALDAFTQRHAANGGTTPVYIPQEVPQTLTNAFRREPSVTATSKVPKLKATQDKLFSGGQYRSTAAGVSAETHRAAVVQSRIDHFKAVNEEFATPAENGAPHDPNTVIVKDSNLRSPVKLENTVGEHNLTDEDVHGTLDQMRHALETGVVKPVDGTIPAHGEYRVIPKTIYDELHASTTLPKSGKSMQIYDAANRKYQRFMLSKPSTAAANIVGNPILAAMGGASPFDIAKGYGIARNTPEILPPRLLNEGLAGVAGQRGARTPIGKFINFSLSHQRASEDAARAALYHHLVGPHVRAVMADTSQTADQVLKNLADGTDPHGAVLARKVEDFLGSMRNSGKVGAGTERGLSRTILFHRWLGHILTLTLYTMPIKYPGRAVLLQRISEIGDDYRKHHGVYPSWYSSMIPLMQHIAQAGGAPGAFTRVLPTGSIWPTSNLQLPLADSSGSNPYGAAISSTNPILRAVAEAPTGMDFANETPYKDSAGAQITPGLGPANIKLLLGQLYRDTPYTSVATPMPGMAADAFPGNMNPAVHKNRYGRPLPPGFATTAIPYGGNTPSLSPSYALGAFSRLALGGSGIQDLPANTVGTQYAARAALINARQGHNKIIQNAAKARAKKP